MISRTAERALLALILLVYAALAVLYAVRTRPGRFPTNRRTTTTSGK